MFEVVYSYGKDLEFKLESKVYAVDPENNSFLIVDGWDKFHWVSIDRCKLLERKDNKVEKNQSNGD